MFEEGFIKKEDKMKTFNVWCEKTFSVEIEVVCEDEEEMWDIVNGDVSFTRYYGNMVGISSSSSDVKVKCFDPDTPTRWYIHNVEDDE